MLGIYIYMHSTSLLVIYYLICTIIIIIMINSILIICIVGCRLFEEFLVKECSQENLAFWKACRKYSDPWLTPDDKLQSVAESIFSEFISHHAPNLVSHTLSTAGLLIVYSYYE